VEAVLVLQVLSQALLAKVAVHPDKQVTEHMLVGQVCRVT
jgi:hypothetical protein